MAYQKRQTRLEGGLSISELVVSRGSDMVSCLFMFVKSLMRRGCKSLHRLYGHLYAASGLGKKLGGGIGMRYRDDSIWQGHGSAWQATQSCEVGGSICWPR